MIVEIRLLLMLRDAVCKLSHVCAGSDELFDFYTDRRADHGSLEETRKFLRDAQTFPGCEVPTIMVFLKEKGLLYEYLRCIGSVDQSEDELPFL